MSLVTSSSRNAISEMTFFPRSGSLFFNLISAPRNCASARFRFALFEFGPAGKQMILAADRLQADLSHRNRPGLTHVAINAAMRNRHLVPRKAAPAMSMESQ